MRFLIPFLLLVPVAAHAQPKQKPAPPPPPATKADIDRLEKKIEEQQRTLDAVIRAQLSSLQALSSISKGEPPPQNDPVVNPTPTPTPTPTPAPRPRRPRKVAVKPPTPTEVGAISGHVSGVSDAIIYVDGKPVTKLGSASMTQEGKQFKPRVLVVQRGMRVEFPNRDAFFHNVFSVTPETNFDLGSYRKGESRNVLMSKPGVVNVYCNMHPQMVGHVLVTPNSMYVRARADGSFTLENIPVGRHRVVAWAPNAKAVATDVTVAVGQSAKVEVELKKLRPEAHPNKDGLPYATYKD